MTPKLFRRLKVSHKLALISVVFLVPDSVLLTLFIITINGYIQFARLEQEGNYFQRPLEHLLKRIPEHGYHAERYLEGDEAAGLRLLELQGEIDLGFAMLEEADRKSGKALQFTEVGLAKRNREHVQVSMVRQEWESLKGQIAARNSSACDEKHHHLIADIRTMITHAGDISNLILDPDLDSYYLMDVTLLTLPQAQDRIASMLENAGSLLKKKSMTRQEHGQINRSAALLREADLDRIISSSKSALREDGNFYGECADLQGRLLPGLERFTAATENFIRLTQQLAEEESAALGAEEYREAGNRALEESFLLWDSASDILDSLLANRIEYFLRRRTFSLFLTGCALLAAVGFVALITRSISGPLTRQAAELTAANTALQAEISERRRIEEALRTKQAQIQAMQDASPLGIFFTDVAGVCLYNNRTYERITGLGPEQAHGAVWQRAIHPEDLVRIDDGWEKAAGEGRNFESIFRFQRPDGATVWASVKAAPVLDNGRVTGYIGAVEDVTARRRAEQELQELNDRLVEASRQAGMADVATCVLHNVGNVLNSANVSTTIIREKLQQSKLSHLLKTAAMIREREADLASFLTSDPKGRQLPAFIDRLAGHLSEENASLLEEIAELDLNIQHIKQIVATQQGFARVLGVTESIEAESLMEEAVQLTSGELERHQIDLVRRYAPAPPVLVDRHKVLQILINLLRNAKDAVSEQDPSGRRVTLTIAPAGEGRVRIAVADSGGGILPENLPKVFRHGFTTKKDGHGFGLHSGALAAREMHGSITAESGGAGAGATFTLELPAMAQELAV